MVEDVDDDLDDDDDDPSSVESSSLFMSMMSLLLMNTIGFVDSFGVNPFKIVDDGIQSNQQRIS